MFLTAPVAEIDRNPDQPRKHFDEDKLRELAESIAANGLIEPIVVRPVDGRYVIIAGERRWRASQIAQVTEVPVHVLEIGEVDAYVLSVAENVNRDDMTIMEEARAYDQLRKYGKDVEEISALFGKRVSTVRERLSLVDLEPHIVGLIDQGIVGPVLGYKLSFLEPGNRRVVVQRLARGEIDHNGACEFADALYDAQQEVGFFDLEEPTEEERQAHVKRSRAVRSTSDQIARLAALLDEISASEPADLAAALGNDVAVRLAELEDVAKRASKATRVLRKAKAVAEARTLVLNPEAVSA